MHADTSDLYAGLNPQQREAVQTLEGPLLIVAGAGSGKTRVVTLRIANLIQHGARPWQILAITFTNKAAGEMRRRVEDLVGRSGVWLSTFHSFCARVLRQEAERLGFIRDFTIYDEDDVETLLGRIVGEKAGDDKRFSVRAVRAVISRLKSKNRGPEEMQAGSYHERLIQTIYQEYAQALRTNQALDFDDLLFQTARLLREQDEVRERYRDRFRYILIDEYQDTNSVQYELVKLLGQGHQNVCATGDPDQSIYSWRGADIQNILSFERDFPGAKVVRLEQNYRSTQRILAVASAVIRNNTQRKERDLHTANKAGEKALLTVVGDQELEAEAVVSQIAKAVDAGGRYRDCAIFYRTNAQSRPFETALIHAAIPYRVVGGTPFYERKEVKDALAYLRLLVNPKDDVAFRRVVNMPRRGVGEASVEKLSARAAEAHCSMLEVLTQSAWLQGQLKPKPLNELLKFGQLIGRFRAEPPFPVARLLENLLKDSGLLEEFEGSGESDRVENLEQLVTAAAIFDEDHAASAATGKAGQARPAAKAAAEPLERREPLQENQASVAGFLENAALIQPTDGHNEAEDRVTLMTLHTAKGLEFPYVFLGGMEDGLLPMRRAPAPLELVGEQDSERELRAFEEERRLFYVGVTRAMERLFLYRAFVRMRFGRSEFAVPSPFLDEIPREFLELDDRNASASGRRPSAPDPLEGLGYGRRKSRSSASGSWSPWGQPRAVAKVRRPKGQEKFDFSGFDDEVARPAGQEEFDDLPSIDVNAARAGGLAPESWEVGDRVHHQKFGPGRVVALSGSGEALKAQVDFVGSGRKTLLLTMANLKRL